MQESFVIRHQNAVVYVLVFLAVLMLSSSIGLLFTQHINIIHVITLSHCCILEFLCVCAAFCDCGAV